MNGSSSVVREGEFHHTELVVGNTVNLINSFIYDPDRDKRGLQFREGTFSDIGRSPNVSKLAVAENYKNYCCSDQNYSCTGQGFRIMCKIASKFYELTVRT